MKIIIKLFIIVLLTVICNTASFSQDGPIRLVNPLYELRVSNFQITGASPSDFNSVTFDFMILHTNPDDSGPFEFSAGQYYLAYNPGVANGGTLSYEIIPNSTDFSNPDAMPVSADIVGTQLRLTRNIDLGAGNGPIVSSIYPGSRIVRVKFSTTAPAFAYSKLNFTWIDTIVPEPTTAIYAYIGDSSVNILDDGTLEIDSSESILPVELSNFTAETSQNNALINWSTGSESNNSGFDIERSEMNDKWTKIGFVQGKGNSTSQNFYFYADNNLNTGKYKYRLKQIDYNGNHEYFYLQNEITIGTPDEFSLNQNYPNPFNPETKIDYRLPDNGNVTLSIFDVNGRLVSTLLNGPVSSGYHSVNFNAADVSSGVYYYKLEFSGNGKSFSKVMKMIVLK
ncbi:MAG TPA: T9SS type A sorting domain-containing protein [Ignavibacteria bacterium]|nr:T9SS type A sorting domain-containing protein [Ignavibacteria bacterium]